MVNKRSLLAVAGAVLMLGSVAPFALAQSPEPSPAAETEVTADVSPAPMVELSQEQYDDILAQLADLAARVESLEVALAGKDEPAAKPRKSTAKPKAPVATSETEPRFTVRDPNPDRGLVTWRDRATNEDGQRIYARRVFCGLNPGADANEALGSDDFSRQRSAFVRVGKVAPDVTRFRPVHQQVTSKLPDPPGQQYGSGEIYELYVSAFNEAGESKRVLVGTYITTPEFMCP